MEREPHATALGSDDKSPQGVIAPVLMTLPRDLQRRARVLRFRSTGQAALEQAAFAAGAENMVFARDAEGAPLPDGDWHWSLTNAEGFVGAVVAPYAVGIDAEPLDRPRRENLRAYLGERDPLGLAHLGGHGDAALTLWTAFEAALKLLGRGVSGLPQTSLDLSDRGAQPGWHSVRIGPRCLPVWSEKRSLHVLSVAVAAPTDRLPTIQPLIGRCPSRPIGAGNSNASDRTVPRVVNG